MITHFATFSDRTHSAPVNSFKTHQRRLAKYQRRLSRKKKFSQNWKKAKVKVQKIHKSIANARKDFLHKTTTAISKNYAIVCIEDLQVKICQTDVVGAVIVLERGLRLLACGEVGKFKPHNFP